jgi:hypothetical protein
MRSHVTITCVVSTHQNHTIHISQILHHRGIKHQTCHIHGCVVLKHENLTCTITHLRCATASCTIIYLHLPSITRYMFHVRSRICVKLHYISASRKSIYMPHAKSYMSIKYIYESDLRVINKQGSDI